MNASSPAPLPAPVPAPGDALYLGLDLGTQSLKARLLDAAAGRAVATATVNFGAELPDYNAPNGYVDNPDPAVRRVDPRLWLAALDLVLAKLRDDGAPLARVEGVAGSAQQHATVYLNSSFAAVLAGLAGGGDGDGADLAARFAGAFSRELSPIWMDRSTARECAELTGRFGPRLRRDTGGPASERFAGPQIRKFAREEPERYRRTVAIHLASSFMASVLAGRALAIDHGDGAGMNLLNLHTLDWDAEIAAFTAPGLPEKLPPVRCFAAAAPGPGKLAGYFARYGLRPGIAAGLWSGDNPCSLVGAGATAPGTAVASLGTSDTFLGAMADYRADPDGYGQVFGNPAGGFMNLVCFTNGSLAREEIRRETGLSWTDFESAFAAADPRGDPLDDNRPPRLLLPYFAPESTPPVAATGVRRDFDPAATTPVKNLLACLESQALRLRLHSRWPDEAGAGDRVLRVTGGASASLAFRRILADVFGARVEAVDGGDAAASGAALMAARAAGGPDWNELIARCCRPAATTDPDPARAARYRRLGEAYRELEESVGQ